MLAYGIARKLRPVGLYDSLLLQDGIALRKMPLAKNSRDWESLPISAIMSFNPVCVRASDSAADTLLSLKRRGIAFKSYPVLDGHSDFIGMVSMDELRKNADAKKSCGELMARGREGNFIMAEIPFQKRLAAFVQAISTTRRLSMPQIQKRLSA